MTVVDAILLFFVIWFLVFFVLLAVPFETQSARGDVVPGTPPSAPADVNLRRRAKVTTLIAVAVWAAVAWVVTSGVVTLDDLDLYHRFGPGSSRSGDGTGG